ncbi:MAG: Maf family protein [Phycisphaerales bacterium]
MDDHSMNPKKLILASRSPRRRQLLTDAGFGFELSARSVDDGGLASGAVNPDQWVMALAYLKAVGGADAELPSSVVLGADTICIAPDGSLVGQPRDAGHAEEILRSFVGVPHSVVTGVALFDPATCRRELFADGASVVWGDVSSDEIESYVSSGQWEGKAGAYNLAERLDAGWPIQYEGDPTSIMGLPMRRLAERLSAWGIEPGVAA